MSFSVDKSQVRRKIEPSGLRQVIDFDIRDFSCALHSLAGGVSPFVTKSHTSDVVAHAHPIEV